MATRMTDLGGGRWACGSDDPWHDYVLSLPRDETAVPAFTIDELAREGQRGVVRALRLRAARTIGVVLDQLERGEVDVNGVLYSGELRLVGYSTSREVRGSHGFRRLRVELVIV